jgi:hypothetical protein
MAARLFPVLYSLFPLPSSLFRALFLLAQLPSSSTRRVPNQNRFPKFLIREKMTIELRERAGGTDGRRLFRNGTKQLIFCRISLLVSLIYGVFPVLVCEHCHFPILGTAPTSVPSPACATESGSNPALGPAQIRSKGGNGGVAKGETAEPRSRVQSPYAIFFGIFPARRQKLGPTPPSDAHSRLCSNR